MVEGLRIKKPVFKQDLDDTNWEVQFDCLFTFIGYRTKRRLLRGSPEDIKKFIRELLSK